MKFNKIWFLIVPLLLWLSGCDERKNHDDDLPSSINIITALKGNNATATIDDLQGLITLVLPPKTDVTQVKLDIETPDGVTTDPASGSIVNLSEPMEINASFSGQSRKYLITARVLPNEIAFLGNKPTFEELISDSDDDIIAAAQWMKDTYAEDFVYLDNDYLILCLKLFF